MRTRPQYEIATENLQPGFSFCQFSEGSEREEVKSSKKVTRKLARRIRSFDEIQRKDELKGAGLLPHKPGSQNRRK